MLHSRRWFLSLALLPACGLAAGVSAATPEQDLKVRHQALFTAYNQRDMKALRAFYAPDYKFVEGPNREIPLAEWLKGLEEAFKFLPKPGKDSATLTRIKIEGDTANTVESRLVQTPSGKLSKPSFTAQTWKKVDGVWKLVLEKEAKE